MMQKGNSGDSERNRTAVVVEKSSNHVFDAAGENVRCYSDSESQGSRTTRRQKARFINSAIYIEPVESAHSVTSLRTESSGVDDLTPHPHSSYRSNSTPVLSASSTTSTASVKRKLCRLDSHYNDQIVLDNLEEETPRNRTYREGVGYREEGADTFRLSVASMSTNTTAKEERERNERKRQEAFEQWLARKEQEKGNSGDSERNRTAVVVEKSSNHVFDAAGENVRCYSDSESQGSRTTRRQKARFINSAIYIEPVESAHSVTSLRTESSGVDDLTPHPHSSYRSNSTPVLSASSTTSTASVKRKLCRLDSHYNDQIVLDNLEEETPRNRTYREGVGYREEGADTFRLSVASMSTNTTAKEERERNERKRQEAFEQWLARKEQEKREKARLEKLKRQTAAQRSAEQREETYRRWLEHKRLQDEARKAEEIARQVRQKQKIEKERQQRQREKEEKLNEWIRKKEEEMKAMKTASERRAARAAIEEERRRANGERAYRDWLRTSKNKPLPVPLNQGELSMRGSVSQMYVNPIPWQSPT